VKPNHFGRVQGARFYSVQKGAESHQARTPSHGLVVTDSTSDMQDFADTAAMIANLDLVVSVDTGVAHLAGAMGKPTWLLTPVGPDWRWFLNRSDSPWYPSMRLYRQKAPNDWGPVMRRVAADLSGLCTAMPTSNS
jgi:ADP-heptose:LPS heptosyltransferase